ncbi:MAG: hypothetical protein ABL921_19075 [Pirellula sp.]
MPCMPLSDTTGEVVAVPRWEYWAIHASVPSALVWRWTGGLPSIAITDRLPVFAAAACWLAVCWLVGWLAIRCDADVPRSKAKRNLMAILIGHSIFSSAIFVCAISIGCRSYVALVMLTSIVALMLACAGRSAGLSRSTDATVQHDTSLQCTVRRRLIGLLVVACVWLASMQVYGATVPTVDRQVRTTDWWLVKHAIDSGRLTYRHDNVLTNGPSMASMPALGLAMLVATRVQGADEDSSNWESARKVQMDRMYVAVVAGKLVHAVLCVLGVAIIGLHLREQYGLLPGLVAAFCLLATPGIAELTRLGRTESMVGVWGAVMLCYWQSISVGKYTWMAWCCLLAGALNWGYGSAVLVGLPVMMFTIYRLWLGRRQGTIQETPSSENFQSRAVAGRIMLIIVLFMGGSCYMRNAWAVCDPIAPWSDAIMQQIGLRTTSEPMSRLRQAYRVRSETVAESMHLDDATELENGQSAFRIDNLVDGLKRVLWASTAHGLLLIPLAILGACVGFSSAHFKPSWGAIGWSAYWISVWWMFSPRLDRDWIGVSFFLAWPAAAVIHWFMNGNKSLGLATHVGIVMVWSLIVIPIWPTSDNRIFVSMRDVRMLGRLDPMNMIGQEFGPNQSSRVFLLGESDDFDERFHCESNSPFEYGFLDEMIASSQSQRMDLMHSRGLTHIYVSWDGIRERHEQARSASESEVKRVLAEMQAHAQIKRVGSTSNPPNGDLFQVMSR